MLYYLESLFCLAVLFSLVNIFPYDPLDFILPGFYLIGICFVINKLFAWIVKVKPNYESQIITALILILIIGPLPLYENIGFLTLVGVLAMASKYVFVFNKQHIFNPAAIAVVGTSLLMNQGASWWAGDKLMLPFILMGGLLIIRKINRFNLVFAFLISSSLFLLLFDRIKPQEVLGYLMNPATLFFSFVMLTEPITSPADKKLRLYFGIFTGFILVIYQTFFALAYTMELALLSANLLGRILHFSTKYHLILKEKTEIATGIWRFIFTPVKPIHFIAGQFLEWSLPHSGTDARGTRRYFTIASSPTEKEIMLAVRVPKQASSFKTALVQLTPGESVYATNLEGEFVLQKNSTTSYVFIAGGIGITPFRSIIQQMIDTNHAAPITLFYLAHDTNEFVFDDLLKEAKAKLALKIVHIVSENPPKNWHGETGHLTDVLIKKYVNDYQSRYFYLSGPQPMVTAYKQMLQKMGVKNKKIRTDFFPGYEENYKKDKPTK